MMIVKKILFITGSYPPNVCGVGDYTEKLFNGLSDNYKCFELFHKTDWKLKRVFKYLKEINSKKADLIHFQYPTEGYAYSFLPLLLMLILPKKKLILTIHELSNRTFKARIFTLILIHFSNKIIVTNEIEFTYLKKSIIFKKKKIFIINIGSNIPVSKYHLKKIEDRKIDLAYFGHIRPLKGIELFLSVAKKIGNSKKCTIIGQNLPKYEAYLDELKISSEGINYILGGSVSETADNLSECKILYLPFPDGVSSRRGSLMAGALNGCIIVTTYSSDPITNNFFEKYCYLVKNEIEGYDVIKKLLGQDNIIDKDISKLMDLFSWKEIYQKHLEVYSLQNLQNN